MLRMRRFLFCMVLISLFSSWQKAQGQDCQPPQVTYIFTGDCQMGEFYVELDFTSLGDSPSVIVTTDVFGDIIDYPVGAPGVIEVGPFYEGDELDIHIQHANDPDCDIYFTGLNPAGSCPFYLPCGTPPITLNYCYQTNETIFWIFEGLGDGSLLLNFLTGEIGGGDIIRIHDGPDQTFPPLFEYSGEAVLDLSVINLFSSGPHMYISLESTGGPSCASGDLEQWSWQISCLTCAVPMFTTAIVDDCDNEMFSIHLDITSTGEDLTVDILYTIAGTPTTIPNVGTGLTVLGPFPIDTNVDVVVQHATDNMCNVSLGVLTDTGYCPQLVVCGEPAIEETYCYGDNEDVFWVYELVGVNSSLYLQFTAGSISGSDTLIIYDGPNPDSPVIFQSPTTTLNLSGIEIIPTSGSLFISLVTNATAGCADGSFAAWAWNVSCLDCIPPVATFDIVQDCDLFQYFIDVNLSGLGSDTELQIINDAGAPTVMASAPGNVLIGPIVSGTPAQVTLVNSSNPICNVSSPVMVNALCPTFVCGTEPLVETYCYGANEDMAWAYALPSSGELRLHFNLGTIQSASFDSLRIYNGPDNNSPLLFEHTNTAVSDLGPPGSAVAGPGNNYYGVEVVATGSNLYMELTSNATTHCTTSNNYDPMEWEVYCVGCVPPGMSYSLEPVCEDLAFNVLVDVTQLNGPLGLQISEATTGQSITASQLGSFELSGFALDSTINVLIQDMDEGGCLYNSGPLVFSREDCVINSCGTDNYEVCYENNGDLWYTFRSDENVPVNIFFHQGQMLPGDNIVIYNGLSGLPGVNVIYNGNNSGNLTGITTSSSNPNNALTLRIRSNEAGSCEDGQASVPIRWDVGCGFVGINELGRESFSVYPNPTEGMLTIDLGSVVDGPVELKVLDMSGRVAYQHLISAAQDRLTTLDLGMLQNGQYMVQLTSANWVGTRAFQIMR